MLSPSANGNAKKTAVRLIRWTRLFSVLVAVASFPIIIVTAAFPLPKAAATALPPGWTRVEVQGTVASVNPKLGTFVLAIPQREKPTTRPVKLSSGSVVQIKSSFMEDVGELRVGDQLRVWGYVQPDGSLLAAHVLLVSRRANSAVGMPAAASPARSGLYGVVLAVRDEGFTLLTDAGQVKEVLRAPIARIQATAGASELKAFDIVQVDGNVLSDGNFSATRIAVEFVGATARRIGGRVTTVVPEASLFVLDETVYVNVLPTTFIVQGTALRSVGDLGVGRTVQVVGAVGATPFVVKGRIITLHI